MLKVKHLWRSWPRGCNGALATVLLFWLICGVKLTLESFGVCNCPGVVPLSHLSVINIPTIYHRTIVHNSICNEHHWSSVRTSANLWFIDISCATHQPSSYKNLHCRMRWFTTWWSVRASTNLWFIDIPRATQNKFVPESSLRIRSTCAIRVPVFCEFTARSTRSCRTDVRNLFASKRLVERMYARSEGANWWVLEICWRNFSFGGESIGVAFSPPKNLLDLPH